MSEETFNQLFPNRYGSAKWAEENPSKTPSDYYSYANLIKAIEEMADYEVILYNRPHPGGEGAVAGAFYEWFSWKVLRKKSTNTEKIIYTGTNYADDYMQNQTPKEMAKLDYGLFLSSANENDRKRELAAFLANISQETGRGDGAERLSGGLFYNEEIKYANGGGNVKDYHQGDWDKPSLPHPTYPVVESQSYHGRGPIQLSWNYNYGAASAAILGDKNTLLNNPKQVVESGVLGWKTAIWFWMTALDPRPSCHQVMTGTWPTSGDGQVTWKPSTRDTSEGRTKVGFGMAVMVINGGVEGGKYANDTSEAGKKVANRGALYQHFAKALGADTTGEKLDTGDMGEYNWFRNSKNP